MTKKKSPIFELRVELSIIKPAIWRTFRIPSDATLADLHVVIQAVMGWTNSHLHEFRAGAKRYNQPSPEDADFSTPAHDETDFTVADVLTKPKQKIVYTYDFGDGWEHVVTVIAIHQSGPALECVAGERACPPEDCGGPFGFDRLLSIIADRKHPEYREMKKWLSGMTPDGYDPAVFDRTAVNEAFSGGLEELRDSYTSLADEWDDEEDFDADGKVIEFPKGTK